MHMPDPQKTGLVHIVGIGGIGMSAIAEVMHTRGYTVQGSDLKDSANLERLRARNIRCLIGHDPANLDGATTLVISSAVKAGNPEFEAAKERGIPIIRRAEMLAELMRPCATVSITGTHGKTTTTSLIADLLKGGGLDPTVIAGGIINDWGTNARIGKGEWMVVEADESDGTFLKLPTQIGVVTNIDPEHMDYWETVQAMHHGFQQFIEAIPYYGLVVACVDHPVVRELLAKLGGAANGRRTLTYGVARDADIRLTNLRPARDRIVFDARLGSGVARGARMLEDLMLPALGHYNALNALAALAVAAEAGVSDDAIRAGLAGFSGVKRRFTHVGEWQGVQVYDDYAHHPVEIAAVLRAARVAGNGRVIAVIQPHRYTRLQSPVQRILRLPRRCRHRSRHAGLFGWRSSDPRHRPRRACFRASPPRPSQGADRRRRGRIWSKPSRHWRSPATWSSVLAPAPSPIGSTRCRRSSPTTEPGHERRKGRERPRRRSRCATP